ncbi:MAG: molybdopterin cofactor-binding domain-containing protein, partial [Polyangiaceae bacterium]
VGIRALPSGTVEVLTGAVEQGMGLFSVLQRVVAATLEIEEERVRIVQEPAKRGSPFDPGAGGSRQTHVTGRAALAAAQQLRERLERLENRWPKDDSIEVRATYEAAHGHDPAPHSFCGFAVEVAVDPETGALSVVDVVCAVDTGTILNPVAHRGQVNGGFMMGLGHALTEELRVSDGEVVNPSLADYKIPTQMDAPPLRIVHYEQAAGPGPFGAKMAGEINTATIAPAIANAIAAACGARVTALPLTAERILAAQPR